MVRVSDLQILEIPGAFWAPDINAFRVLLDRSAEVMRGDLAELGVLYGRSAVLIGSSLAEEETFTVVDLFGGTSDAANEAENDASYPDLSRQAFEDNYVRIHGKVPVVVTGPSESIVDHVPPHSHRFVHIDASHLHAHVVKDLEAASRILLPDGIIVLDDIRSEHTPGVAAAAWQAVLTLGLRPFAVSTHKMYATFGDAAQWRDALLQLATSGDVSVEIQVVGEEPLIRFWQPRGPAPRVAWRRYVPEVAWPVVSWVGRRVPRVGGSSHRRPGGPCKPGNEEATR